jgi:hypothetical protein
MGRPLKIKKITESAYNSTTGANPGVDIGFNGLLTLTNPVAPSPIWDTDTEYLGVVGGAQPPTVATATYPIVKCRVFVTGFAEADGVIIRQKGSRKFMVADITARTALVSGFAYRITVVGNTDWASYGAPTAQVGTIFTATAALGNTGTGRVNAVGTCVLTSDLSPTAGNMSISYFLGDSTEVAVSKLTNKFLQNFDGGETGGNANTGDVWDYDLVVNNVVLDANFFTDEGTVAKSGAETATWGANGSEQNAGGTLDLGIVENYTS